ncbi:MAG: hypothetical protein ACXV8O_01230 [Methylobacter sp.]
MLSIYGHKWSSHLGVADDGTGALTDAAKTWQKGLAGITVEQIKHGFDVLIFKNHDWPPSLPEFRKLCLSKNTDNAPTLDDVVSILVMVPTRQGSVATRYKHPLALAVSLHDGVDMFALRTAKFPDAKRMVKTAYEQCLKTGWVNWTEDDLKEPDSKQKALGHDKPRDKSVGVSAFRDIRAALLARSWHW